MAHYQQQPLAVWNPARDAWEIPGTEGLTCEHLAVYSETWPTSGSMRNGTVFARPTSGPVITDSGSSFLPTPWASTFGEVYDLDGWEARRARVKESAGNGNGFGMPLGVAVQLLPTPTTEPTTGNGHARNLGGEVRLLPTPDAQMFNGGRVQSVKALREGLRQEHANDIPRLIQLAGDSSRWGDYAEAIARHERAIGRPAPAPTEPGRKGNPRLSARFVEWMMGLPAGWVTGCGLTRAEELKALGNGVVPQQAAAALHVIARPNGDDSGAHTVPPVTM